MDYVHHQLRRIILAAQMTLFSGQRQRLKPPIIYIILKQMYRNWRTKRRLRSGNIESISGATHSNKTLQESLSYINQVFEDYLTYAHLSIDMLEGKRVLEIGPGDNLGVALKFLLAGASQVVCIDKFFSKRDGEQQRKIYRAMKEQLHAREHTIFDEVVDLERGDFFNPQKLYSIFGTGIEEAETAFAPASFDLIVSRAVLEESYDLDTTFSVMARLLVPGGLMIHKIDLRDYGMFSLYRHHPLTFLTIPQCIYNLMTRDCAQPNRKLINYYRHKAVELGLDAQILITSLISMTRHEVVPHKERVRLGIDYDSSTLFLLKRIRPSLQAEFRELPDEDLLVSGIFLIARKLYSENPHQHQL
jgi:SAM-dependent methyltransferase